MAQDAERSRLVLTLKTYERIKIGDEIEVQLVLVKGQQARVAFFAPRSTKIWRTKVEREGKEK